MNLEITKAGSRPDRVDGYLSRKAQAFRAGALVYELPDGQWILRGGGPDIGLGGSFHDAHQAIIAMQKAEKK